MSDTEDLGVRVALPDLPRGWAWRSVEALAADEPRSITDGPFGSNLKTSHYTEEGPRVIRLQNIGEGEFLDAEAHISHEHFETLRAHEAAPGDIVVASLGETLPRACVVPDGLGPAIVKADCPRVRPSADHNASFLMYALNSPVVREQAAQRVHGLGRPRLNLASLKKLMLPVPTREEQDRVVERIELFEEVVSEGLSALERALARLAPFRSSTIRAALRGDANAYGVDTRQELGRAPREALSELAAISYGLTAKADESAETGPQFLRITDIQDGQVDWASVPRCVPPGGKDATRFELRTGDIVFARIGATTGKSYRVGEDVPANAVFASYLIRVRPSERVDSEFLALYFQGADYWAYIHETSRGIGRPAVNGTLLGGLEVPVPSMAAQHEAVSAAKSSLRSIAETKSVLETQMSQTEHLRKAILHRELNAA